MHQYLLTSHQVVSIQSDLHIQERIYDMQAGRFEFRRGPIFTNLLLGDEINRTPPKTQAALLEAMAEQQVSIDGATHRLPEPFLVLVTDNPIEYEGTYPLPEAQLDRFAIRLELEYLSEQEEATMLRRRLDRGSVRPTVQQVVDAHDLLAMQESVEQVTVHDDVLQRVCNVKWFICVSICLSMCL